MSRWWRDRLTVLLRPDAIRVERRGSVLRRRARTADQFAVRPGTSPAWQGALDGLAEALGDKRWQGTDVDVELSGHFVRWLLLPPSDVIATDEEWEGYARMEMAAVHGERAAAWSVSLTEQRPGETDVACAVDSALIEALTAVCETGRSRLSSVAPRFSAAFDRRRQALRAPVCAFAQLEPGRATLAVIDAGRWRAITSVRCAGRWSECLHAELTGMSALTAAGDEGGRLYVATDGVEAALPARIGPWDVVAESLEGPAVAHGAAFQAAGVRP